MSTRVDYNRIIEYIKDSKDDIIEITQKKVKKLSNNELPKSFFSNSYIVNGKNKLARYILDEGLEFEVIEPKIIIRKKGA